jgi:hypothetical protein
MQLLARSCGSRLTRNVDGAGDPETGNSLSRPGEARHAQRWGMGALVVFTHELGVG